MTDIVIVIVIAFSHVNVYDIVQLPDSGTTPNTCIPNCSQTAADSDTVTTDSYKKLALPYPTVSLPTSYDVPFSHNTYATNETDKKTTGERRIVP